MIASMIAASMIASIARISRSVLPSLVLPLIVSVAALAQSSPPAKVIGKTVELIRMFQSDSDVGIVRTPCQNVRDFFDHSGEAHDITAERPAVCDHVLDVIAGEAEPLQPVSMSPIRAVKVAIDSHHRIVLTEPTTRSVHILDFENRKYTRIDGAKDDRMLFPYGVAVDAEDRVYVTDMKRGMIEVFNPDGKFKKFIGNYKGESAFETPASIAIDRASGRIYLTDTARHFVLMLDREGKNLGHIGKRGGGTGPSEFRRPTDIALHGSELFVLDTQNQRIQVFDLEGHYKRQFQPGGPAAGPVKGMAIDAQGFIYILLEIEIVQVLDPEGQPLFRVGHYGTEPGEFISSQGISIDSADRLYVTDTGNHRVQVFQIANAPKTVRAAAIP